MRVALREKLKGGKTKDGVTSRKMKSLYLDIYLGKGHKRQYEFLGFDIYAVPKTKAERAHNAEILHAAKIVMAERETEVQTGRYGITLKEQSSGLTLLEFLVAESMKRKPQTEEQWRCMINHVRAAKIEKTLMTHISGDQCLKLRDHLRGLAESGRLSKFTTYNYLSLFRTGLRAAYRARLTKENLVDRFDQLPNGQSTRQYLTQEELDRFSSAPTLSKVSREVFLFSALCGMRISDIRSLSWEKIFDSVVTNKDGVTRSVSEVRYTIQKTGRAHILPLGDQARRILGQRGTGAVWVWIPGHSTLTDNIKRMATKAGIEKVITMHCARHTCATIMLSKGVALKTVSQLLGHSSIRTTEIYAKVLEGSLRSAADLMSFDGPMEEPMLRMVK